MECEICGATEAPYLVLIEGAKMQACRDCAQAGRIISYPKAPLPTKEEAAAMRPTKIEFELVDGFGMIIRNARMKSHLPLSVLAEKLSEKESFLERVEHEGTHPGEALARKLEKELGIKLLEQVEVSSSAATDARGRKEVTLGDILEFQKKKKE